MAGLQEGDTIFFIAAPEKAACIYAGQIRNELGSRLDLLEKTHTVSATSMISQCMKSMKKRVNLGFTHNPFSMPQGGLEALNEKRSIRYLSIPV